MLFVDVDGKMTSIACATNHTLDVQVATIDTSTKDNGNGRWQTNEAGMRSWTVSSENLVAAADEQGHRLIDLYSVMTEGKLLDIAFSLQTSKPDYSQKLEEGFNAPEGGWKPDESNCLKGKALITALNISAPNDGKATGSITLTGVGALVPVGGGIGSKTAQISAQPEIKIPVPETATANKAASK